jgi:hypothetical protein
MDKKIIKGLIDEKLEVIQEQFSIIREYEGKIPIIELDLIMASIRDLYEFILGLQLENMGGAMLKTSPKKEPPEAAPPPAPVTVEMPEKEEIQEPVIEKVETPVEVVTPTIEPAAPVRLSSGILSMEPVTHEEPVTREEPVTETPPVEKFEPYIPEPTVSPVAQPLPPAPTTPETPVPPAPQSPPGSAPVTEAGHDHNQPHEKYQRITFDLFSEGAQNTLADRLREGQEKRIADKLQENKVIDLRTTIGINDKFLFINELFEGNMRIYDEAVQKLNASTNLAQADLLMLDLKIVYNWDSESPTVKKFVELVRKKF